MYHRSTGMVDNFNRTLSYNRGGSNNYADQLLIIITQTLILILFLIRNRKLIGTIPLSAKSFSHSSDRIFRWLNF